MITLILAFFYALFATLGFCFIFHVPSRHIPTASIIGGIGWVVYRLCMFYETSVATGCFLAAFVVGFASYVAARAFKEASTIFVIPGILCLVPGSGMYNTMVAMVSGDLDSAASIGSTTLMMAGAIALGILTVGALLRIILSIVRRAGKITNKL